MSYQVEFNTRWADFDPNRHMRHTAYNDYAAEARVRYFKNAGTSIEDFARQGIGPVLFTECTTFKKEILLGEKITVNVKLSGSSDDLRKWKIRHEVFNEQGNLAAIIEVFGAWIDLHKRKLTALPDAYRSTLDVMEKTTDFEVI